MAADVTTGGSFEHGTPKELFSAPVAAQRLSLDVSPDGKRFLLLVHPAKSGAARLNVILNWTAGLKK